MRNLLALGTLLAFMPVAHAADKGAEFTHNAEYRVRYQHDQAWKTSDSDADTNKNSFTHRFKLDTAYKASEKFAAHLTLLHNAAWGNFNSTSDAGTATTDGVGDNQNMVLVNQVYGTWMINDAWSLKFGRGGATIADGSVISQNDWQAQPYAFDGVLANYEHEMFRLNLFGVKAIDNPANAGGAAYTAANGNDDAEANFYGFAMDWKSLPEFLKMANIHLLQVNKDEMGYATAALNPSKSEMRYGVVLAGDVAGVDYKLNYAAHTGEAHLAGVKTDLEGSMMAAEVGYSMPEMMKSRFHIAYHQDTGNKASSATKNEGYDSFYTEKHNSAGMMDVLGWGNLTFMKAGYTFSPMDQVDVGLAYWMFTRTENSAAATKGANANIIPAAAGASTSDELGSEIDLHATKTYDGGMSISAWIGMFMPGKYLKDSNGKDDTYNQAFVEAKMTF